MSGFEALARWNDSELGIVSPQEFVLAAERSHLITDLDRAVLNKATQLASGWLEPHMRIAVNVSSLTIISDGFCQHVMDCLSAAGLTPEQLELEITESALIKNWEAAKSTLQRLNDCGVRLALDDFGTGYSSLTYVSQFPIHRLKIDKSFLSRSNKTANLQILKAIIQLANGMNLEVIAEGVETRDHLTVLKGLGCHEAQGFYFAKPIPAPDVPQYIAAIENLSERRSA